MSHSVTKPVDVLEVRDVSITALDTWSSYTLCAISDGSLRLYDGQQLKKSVASVGKSITQVCVCDSFSIVVCVVDAHIVVYDLPDLTLHGRLESSKGCEIFHMNRPKAFIQKAITSNTNPSSSAAGDPSGSGSGSTLMIAVGVKRKVIVYRWENRFFRQHTELALASSPKDIVWAGKCLFLATSKVFLLAQVDSGAMLDITAVGKKRPLLLSLLKQEVILVRDQQALFLSWEGKPTRAALQWMAVPSTICYCHPYIVTALPNVVEVRNANTLTIAQTIRFKNAKYLAVNDTGDTLLIGSPVCVKRMHIVPFGDQVDELVQRAAFTEALSLLQFAAATADEQDERLNDVHILYAYHLFNNGEYEDAMMHFQQTDLNPRQILAMFPDVMPSGQCRDVRHPVQVKPIHGEENLLRALSTLIPYLAQFRARLMLSSNNNDNGSGDHDDGGDDERKRPATATTTTTAAATATANGNENEMPLPVLVDTVLLKAYLLTDSNLVMPFLSQRNRCDIEESQNILRAYEKYGELVVLYRSKGYHKNALELLATLGQNANHLHPLYGSEETVKYLQILSAEPQHTALVLQFSQWVLRSDPDQGLRIFTYAHTTAGTDGISPHAVLEHLKKNCDIDIVIAYLESLIDHCHETNSVFHNELVHLYVESMMKLLRDDPSNGLRHNPAGSERGRLGIIRKRLLQFLESSVYYIPEKMLVILSRFPRSADMLEERAILLSRISQHSQALYIYARRLQDHRQAEQYCERFYSKQATHHDEGKDVYLELLRVYLKPNTRSSSSSSTTTGGDTTSTTATTTTGAAAVANEQPMVEPALALLSKHFARINPAQALELLPEDTPIAQLAPFLNAILLRNRQTSRDTQVIKNLRRAENIQVRQECLSARTVRVVITDTTICERCHNRIGNSAFHRYPHGVVVHYICSDDKYVCPVTNRRFD